MRFPAPNRSKEEELSGLRRLRFGSELFHRDEFTHAAAIAKFDNAGDLRKESVVFAPADIHTRFERCAALPNKDRAARNELATEGLDAQPLRIRITTVLGTT